jgi:hypothetical protein
MRFRARVGGQAQTVMSQRPICNGTWIVVGEFAEDRLLRTLSSPPQPAQPASQPAQPSSQQPASQHPKASGEVAQGGFWEIWAPSQPAHPASQRDFPKLQGHLRACTAHAPRILTGAVLGRGGPRRLLGGLGRLPGVGAASRQEQPRAVRNSHREQPGAARSSQEQPQQPGAARSSQEQPGAARSSQEHPGAARSTRSS